MSAVVSEKTRIPLSLVLVLAGTIASVAMAAGYFKSDMATVQKTVAHHDRGIDRMQEDLATVKTKVDDQKELLKEIRDDVKELRKGR